jgi:hypothetical protein
MILDGPPAPVSPRGMPKMQVRSGRCLEAPCVSLVYNEQLIYPLSRGKPTQMFLRAEEILSSESKS